MAMTTFLFLRITHDLFRITVARKREER